VRRDRQPERLPQRDAGERYLTIHLHELLMYLGEKGVATLLIGAHQGLIGAQMHTPVDASYLADAVILLRYFEARGRGAPGDLGDEEARRQHERTIREFRSSGRHQVGEPLRSSAACSPACRVRAHDASEKRRCERERARSAASSAAS
jgi:hypothetical protein